MKRIIKWLENLSIFIYAAVMMFGNVIMSMVVTEFAMGLAPLIIFNAIMVTAYLIGIFGRFIK